MNLEQEIHANPLSVRPLSYQHMGAPLKSYFDRLQEYQAPFVRERLLMDGNRSTDEEYQEAFCEFKKFVALGKITRKPLAMTSDRIDEVWHQFILFTKDYAGFCAEFYGGFLHHNPNIPSRPARQDAAKIELGNLVRGYNALYGPMPAIWGIGAAEQSAIITSQVKP